MQYGIAFTPLVPMAALWIALAIIGALAIVLLLARSPGAWWRLGALLLIALALANPSFTREERDPLSSVAVLVIDKSPSQNFGARQREADETRTRLTKELAAIKGLDLRIVEAGAADGETDGTKLFSALSATLADVPPERVAGAILVTDGRVHDIPARAAELGWTAPVHALITGRAVERDRRVAIVAAPRFGIVGQTQTITYRIQDQNIAQGAARVRIKRDGDLIDERSVRPGVDMQVEVPIAHPGANIVEITADAVEGELTEVNNRAVVSIDGVRDKLRVLLVSGEPHVGERTWRNLLKSDPSVDLVHFTILRPPEKQDGTPIYELSLIAFPTRELFQQKINEFNLIIFDRYARQGVLPIAYFDNIARYVKRGGAVLIAAGPDYASSNSIWRTPLDVVLPAEPAGVTEQAFHARLSDMGKRHPVTRGLDGANANPPHWSRFFRLVDTRNITGSALMDGPDGKPVLLLSRQGEGRVAMLLSDHIWLWARGYEGGGPHIDLLRRLSHWLMKQPDLEEEALRLSLQSRDLVVTRNTMADKANEIEMLSPSGLVSKLALTPAEPGVFKATLRADELGLWQASDGDLKALIHVGPANPREFAEVTSTPDMLAPLAKATGGSVRRLVTAEAVDVPRVVAMRGDGAMQGEGWIGLKMRDASVARGLGIFPLFAGLVGLMLLLGAVAATWLREGR